ncbi:MAG: HAD family hydrolase [Gemmatimonadetes bacterium]|nr:HAD family hydrolase [Gemmatimonadota bacterium]
MRASLSVLACLALLACAGPEPASNAGQEGATGVVDPLPSWNDGPARSAVLDFVARVTAPGSPDFVPEAERVAVFDNDGTLWAEQPLYFQLAFAIDRARELAVADPELAENALLKALASGEPAALAGVTEHDVLDVIARTHSGLTLEEFNAVVSEWLATARHPRFDRPYTELVYQPMLELLAYLRASGFKTYIVSGGGIDFMRSFTEEVYGIPPEQVVGSMGKLRFEIRDGVPVLLKEPGVYFLDDKEGKPVGIARFIGRRPILAFGNSDGDLAMLQYTAGGDGARFVGIVHHDDADREWAYDRQSKIGRLDRALDEAEARGWTVVSMRNDFATVFPPDLGK